MPIREQPVNFHSVDESVHHDKRIRQEEVACVADSNPARPGRVGQLVGPVHPRGVGLRAHKDAGQVVERGDLDSVWAELGGRKGGGYGSAYHLPLERGWTSLSKADGLLREGGEGERGGREGGYTYMYNDDNNFFLLVHPWSVQKPALAGWQSHAPLHFPQLCWRQ